MINKKFIIISSGAVIVVAGLVFAVLFFILTPPKKSVVAETNTSEVKLSADGSRDYGACTILEKDFIQSTLGVPAADLQGPDTVGLATLANGDQVQVCSYAFIPGGTSANQFNNNNAFTVEVFLHKNKESKDAFISMQDPSAKSINGIGDSALFMTKKLTEGNVNYVLTVFSELRHYTFSINQPSDSQKFTEDSARKALNTIASSLNYK